MMNFHRLAALVGAMVCLCNGMYVTVPEKQQSAMLFQSVVLPCHYRTSSTQQPVVQWWYKSFCDDRTGDSFLPRHLPGTKASGKADKPHVDCADRFRTVRVVASAQGSTMTRADYYTNRDVSIINKADLRIGQVQWGDSGVYFCKVVVSDDLEGTDEAQMELLVLGRTSEQADILPEFDVEIMPEWAFVGCVGLGSILFLLLMGICWCQCCPHSCCCYVKCCCCPETCCCPRHLYEAGKKAKSGPPAQMQMYPYFIPGVPTVMPLGPKSHPEANLTSVVSVPSMASIPTLENNLAGVCSDYRLKARQDHRGSMQVVYRIKNELAQVPTAKMATLQPASLSELSSLHEGRNADFRHTYHTVQVKALPPIADADDQVSVRTAPRAQGRRRRERDNYSDDELERWNACSEHTQRKPLSRRGRTGSLDELEDFARSYNSRSRRAELPDNGDYSPPRRRNRDDDEGWDPGSRLPLPQKRRGTWDGELASQPAYYEDYDGAFLTHVMESKARGNRGAARPAEDSDTLSKGKGGNSSYSRSPSHRPDEEDPLPPYSECEAEHWYRTRGSVRTERLDSSESTMRASSHTRPKQGMSAPPQEIDRRRNLSTTLSRNTLKL
ncbi:immunoglobulin-like domain-containing receptor 2 isoform X1 [Hippocampus zosterae]|uniref:immunoglobulin-like domain-containing receptor 2 isoform X1 n=1 Tax=Hippocampus zosterae TaxID=109293 RepID=UPI00223D629B|nr:immunoglobulin-like domain-containing receptor 2 isoform X1 [Hippocampus zosterae]